MKPRFRSLVSRVAPLVGLTVFLSLPSLHAAPGVWTGTTSGGNWSDTANWSGGTVADGAGSLADFSTLDLPAGAFTVALDSNRTIGSMSFGDIDGATAGTWALSGATTLTLDGSPTISVGVSTSIAPILAGTAGFTKSGAANLILTGTNTVSGTVSVSAGQLTAKNGAALGTSTLNLANGTTYRFERTTGNATTFQGNAITVATASSATMTTDNASNGYSGLISGDANSTFTIGATGATTQCSFNLGANTQQFGSFLGRVEIFDGTSIRFSSTSNLNNGGASAIWDNNTSGNITARNTGTVNLGSIVGSGSISGSSGANGTTTFVVGGRNEDCTYNGTLVDATPGSRIAALTKVGSGTLTLTHATGLSWGGVTNVNEGTLKINGAKTGTGATTVKTATTLTGTGSLAGTTTIQNGGTLAPGDGAVGNISFANLSLATGSTVEVEFGTGNDSATVQTGGTLTLAAGVNIDVNGFNINGSYPIFNVTGATVSGTPSAALAVVNGDPAKVYTFSSNATAVFLNIGETDPSNFWNVDGAGSWGTASNWTKNLVPNAPGANAKVGPGVGGAGGSFTPTSFAIDLDDVRTVGEIVLNDDFGTAFTIAPGTAGSLLMDNNAQISNIVVAKGSHFITAPIAVDADDVSFDVGDLLNLEASGVISSSASGGGVVKAGAGTLRLTGTNTYDGGTVISAGALAINNKSSLGNVAVPATFTGGTLRILNDLTDSRSYQVSGSSNAVIDTNAFNYTYGGVVSSTGGGTGGITKTGAGTLFLSTAQTYTGATTVNAGVLEVATGGSINGAALNFGTTAGALFHVNGGSFNGTTSTVSAGITGFRLSSGSATFTGALNAQDNATGALALINVLGGNLSAASLSVGRSSNAVTVEPAAGATNSGFLVDGAGSIVNITGNLSVAGSNSTANARMDAGSVTVGGSATIGLNNSGRWSVLDVNGGTFTLNDTATGVQLGNGQTGNAIFIVQDGGVANVGKFTFNAAGAVAYSEIVKVNGGTLYVGAGGMVRTGANALCVSSLKLQGGTLAASADWTSAIDTELSGAPVIQAADSLAAAFNITLSGVLSGSGGFTKTGAGTLTLSGANTYGGTTNITAGKLVIAGNQSGATGDVTTTTGTTLGGNGNIGGNVTIASGATHQLAVAATAGAQVTRVISGTLTLSGGDIIDLTAAATPAAGSYTLATATGGITGTLATSTINYNGINGTLAIVGGNSLVLTVTGSGYASWASTKGLTAGVNDGPTDDPDFDGVDNALEFVLGGEPLTSDPSILPDPAVTSTDFVFTFNRSDESEAEIALTFQHGNNLSSWTDVAIGAAGAGVVAVAENDASPDLITVTIPKGANTSLFGRLQAVK